MSGGDKSKLSNLTSHVSLFPPAPWQLINKYFGNSTAADSLPRPPTPPGSTAYRMFGNYYNTDDVILRSLELQGVRRVYPQTYNRKRELRKINFSILANYLDLLDIITREPSSSKRTEKLDHLAILFINMHHLVNEYRQHQARDLLREILKYQVHIGSETVEKAEQYLLKADDLIKAAGNDIIIPGPSQLDPDLNTLIQSVLDETLASDAIGQYVQLPKRTQVSLPTQSLEYFPEITEDMQTTSMSDHIDPVLWQFLLQNEDESPAHDQFETKSGQ